MVHEQLAQIDRRRAKFEDKKARARSAYVEELFSKDDLKDEISRIERNERDLDHREQKLRAELETDYIDLMLQRQDEIEQMEVLKRMGPDFYQLSEEDKLERMGWDKDDLIGWELKADFYTHKEWVDLTQLFNVQVRADSETVMITCLAGERNLPVTEGTL